jgi:hypothetical protein
MKLNESDAGHRIAVTQNGHAAPLAPSETEIWTNDRHLLAAVAHFGLAGRSA